MAIRVNISFAPCPAVLPTVLRFTGKCQLIFLHEESYSKVIIVCSIQKETDINGERSNINKIYMTCYLVCVSGWWVGD